MSTDRLAFMIGLLGSMHCVGMCGPLAFAIPSLKKGWFWLFWDKLSYQLGRIISYCLLGILIGLTSRQLWMSGLQQAVSIISGILILGAAFSRLTRKKFASPEGWFIKPFHRLLSYALNHRANHLIVGLVNGFLPCGFVYLALAGAVNTGSVQTAVSYMFWYGLGTLPLMFVAGISAGFTTTLFRQRINQTIPYLMICLGLWFILRGMELNIPYLSPPPAANASDCR